MIRLWLRLLGYNRLHCICDITVDLGSWFPPCLDGLLHSRHRGRSCFFGLLLCRSLRRGVRYIVAFHVFIVRKPCQCHSTACIFNGLCLSLILATTGRVHCPLSLITISPIRGSFTISAMLWSAFESVETRLFMIMSIANKTASAVVMCLPSDDTLVFHTPRSFHAAPTPKLTSWFMLANSVT